VSDGGGAATNRRCCGLVGCGIVVVVVVEVVVSSLALLFALVWCGTYRSTISPFSFSILAVFECEVDRLVWRCA